jgi:hypothetical protein
MNKRYQTPTLDVVLEYHRFKGATMKFAVRLVASLLVLAPTALAAQDTLPVGTPLANVIRDLYQQEIITNIAAGAPLAAARSDFDESLIITQAISNQLSTFPLGSSAGGFTWTLNPGIGAFSRSTNSFGPLFAERAMTVGRGKMNLGVNFQHTTYKSFEGRNLDGGDIGFYTDFGGGVIGHDRLDVDVGTDTFGVFANYGINDRLDVGVAVPFVKTRLDATIRFAFLDDCAGCDRYTLSGGGTATGLGDIVVRGKYKAFDLPGGGVAAAADFRLPSGDEMNLLGIPGSQLKVYGIVSAVSGIVSPHVNLGYTFSRGNDAANDPNSVFLVPPDELTYTVGADVAVGPRLTIAGDLVGRAIRNMPRLVFTDVGLGLQEFVADERGTLNEALASIGAKFNAWGNLLTTFNLLLPVTDGGLRANPTPVVGFDYSF